MKLATRQGRGLRTHRVNGRPIACPSSRAQQSCSARPVRAPMARKRFAQGKAPRKNLSAQQKALQKAQPTGKNFF